MGLLPALCHHLPTPPSPSEISSPLVVCGIVHCPRPLPQGWAQKPPRPRRSPGTQCAPPHPCLPGPHIHSWISGSLTTQLLAQWASGFEPSRWDDTKKVSQPLALAPSSWSARSLQSKSWQELEVAVESQAASGAPGDQSQARRFSRDLWGQLLVPMLLPRAPPK